MAKRRHVMTPTRRVALKKAQRVSAVRRANHGIKKYKIETNRTIVMSRQQSLWGSSWAGDYEALNRRKMKYKETKMYRI